MSKENKAVCRWYFPWTTHGLQTAECLEFFQGQCGAELCEFYQLPCRWRGYPEGVADGAGRWLAPAREPIIDRP